MVFAVNIMISAINPYFGTAKPNDICYKEDIVISSIKNVRTNKISVLSKDICSSYRYIEFSL
jgi:hypothetical protein